MTTKQVIDRLSVGAKLIATSSSPYALALKTSVLHELDQDRQNSSLGIAKLMLDMAIMRLAAETRAVHELDEEGRTAFLECRRMIDRGNQMVGV